MCFSHRLRGIRTYAVLVASKLKLIILSDGLQPVLLSVQYEYTKINSRKKGFFYFFHSYLFFFI